MSHNNRNYNETYGQGHYVTDNWRRESGKRYEPQQERAVRERLGERAKPVVNYYTMATQKRLDGIDSRRNYDNQPLRQTHAQPDQNDTQNTDKSKKDKKHNENPKTDKKSNDIDILLGTFPYVKTESHWKKLRDESLPKGGRKKYIPCKSSTLTQQTIEEDLRVRYLIISPNPDWYGDEASKLFKSDSYELSNKSKFFDVITQLGNDIASAKQFYNPRQVFVVITEYEKAKNCDFNLMMQYTCAKNEHQALIIDPLHREPCYSFSTEKERVKSFVDSLKWGIKTYNKKAGERNVDEMAKEGIDLDTL